MKILILGDLHGHVELLPTLLKRAKQRHGITAALQVGDFGFFKGIGARLQSTRLPVPVHVIDGNHEDHRYLTLQIAQGLTSFGAKNQIVFHQRGTVFDLGGCAVGCIGGALNADRDQEDEDFPNWVTETDVDRAAECFNAEKPPVILSHSCPHSLGIGIRGNPDFALGVVHYCRAQGFDTGPWNDCGEPGLTRLWRKLSYRPRIWLFGHYHSWHEAVVDGCQFTCVGCADGRDGRKEPLEVILDTEDLTVTTNQRRTP
jgi:predicted phosphodiesterase